MTAPGRSSTSRLHGFDAEVVTRAMVSSQTLFTAGHVLTTGGFLYYFAQALKPSAFEFSVLLVVPEVSQAAALWARSVIGRLGSRKRTWLAFSLLARVAAVVIPLTAFSSTPLGDAAAFWLIVAALAVSQACQGIAYVAYISWLSDIVPQQTWGGFFALRRIVHVSVMLFAPAGAALLRGSWSDWRSDEAVRQAYIAVFLSGGGLLLASIVPVLRIPDLPVRWRGEQPRWSDALRGVVSSPALRRVVGMSLWLAFFQGLTQSAMFRYQVNVLGLSLEQWLLLSAVMYALQIPWSWLGGHLSDRWGDRVPLMAGLLLTSCAMPFWLLARPGDAEWLIGAYVLWGLFGLVNVCQKNLLLRSAPSSDNAVPIALYEHAAGLMAGIAGLLGGWLLDSLLRSYGSSPLLAFQILFTISWAGRTTAPLWLALGVES